MFDEKNAIIRTQLNEQCVDYILPHDIEFVVAFTDALEKLGYIHNGLERGYCWGKKMIIFRKAGVKAKTVYARIYIRDNHICLRMFFNKVTKHAAYIEGCPDFIKNVFVGEYANCKHCTEDCNHRKCYEIDGQTYEKCDGCTFEFYEPTVERLPDYLGLFCEFFPPKKQS